MGIRRNLKSVLSNNKMYIFLVLLALFSGVLFRFAYIFQEDFHYIIMDVATYLTWHIIFEFCSVLVGFVVFVVAFYTYDQTRNLRSMLVGSVFVSTSLIDFFHMLSYKGMPAFFVENTSANRATVFWIISRLLMSLGLAVTSFIPGDRKSRANKMVFAAPPFFFSIFVLIVATYFPWMLPAMYVDGVGLTPTKIILEYVVIFLFAVAIFKLLLNYGKIKDDLIALFAGALMVNIFSEVAFVSYDQVYDIYNYLGHIYKFIASFMIFRVIFIYNVQKPYVELSAAQKELRNYAENLDKLVDQRTRQIMKMNEMFLEDLKYARDIQKALLPSKLPDSDEVSFSARYFPAERVSGDIYDIFKLDNMNIGFFIADVSGHGVPAAMLTVFLKQSIRARNENNGNEGEIHKPSEVLRNLYDSFNDTNFGDEVYIVLVYGVYNLKSRRLTYASAGLNVSPLIVKSSGLIYELEMKGFPICKFRDFYSSCYTDKTIQLEGGDKVLFYTDGLIESENSEGERFTELRLKNSLSSGSKKTCTELSKAIETDLFNFIDMNRLKDDITFFVMEVK